MIALSEIQQASSSEPKSFSISGSLQGHEVRQAKKILAECIENHSAQSLDIDASSLDTVSSVVIAWMLSGLRVAETVSCRLRYVNLPTLLFNTARVGGVESILTGCE